MHYGSLICLLVSSCSDIYRLGRNYRKETTNHLFLIPITYKSSTFCVEIIFCLLVFSEFSFKVTCHQSSFCFGDHNLQLSFLSANFRIQAFHNCDLLFNDVVCLVRKLVSASPELSGNRSTRVRKQVPLCTQAPGAGVTGDPRLTKGRVHTLLFRRFCYRSSFSRCIEFVSLLITFLP